MELEEFKIAMEELSLKFSTAEKEYNAQNGYIKGALDSLLALVSETDPAIAMAIDKVIKTFSSLEGVYVAGLQPTFWDLQREYKSLLNFSSKLKSATIDDSNDSSYIDELDTDIDNLDISALVSKVVKQKESKDEK